MKTTVLTAALLVLSAASANAQTDNKQTKPATATAAQTATALPKIALKADATPLEMARAAIAAHGGDKFKSVKTIKMIGSVDVTASSFPQAIAGSFAIIFKGDKYRLQIQTPFQPFTQTFDGVNTFSSIGNFRLPPINRLGLPLLMQAENPNFKVEALGDKKKRGFRVTSPEGFATDFFLDEKTAQVKSYSSTYTINDRNITTVVEHDKLKEVNGILLPERYAQRFDAMGQTFYADFNAKEITVNTEIADDVFTLQQQ